MSSTISLLGIAVAVCGLAQNGVQKTADALSARELYYTEQPAQAEPLPVPAPPVDSARDKNKQAKRASTASNRQAKATSEKRSTAPAQSRSDNGVNISEQSAAPATTPIPVVDHFGLRYNLLLVDKNTNESRPVDADGVFHTGDCLALELEPNRAGYLYVLQKSRLGTWDALFPTPQIRDESEVVQGRTKQRVPQNYCFELDEQREEEHLYLILSRNPEQIYQLHDAVFRKDNSTEQASLEKSSTNLSTADTTQLGKHASEVVTELSGRGFKLTKVSTPAQGERAYSYYVVPATLEKMDTVFADIRIKHE